jgi:16S rRNA (guanine527-N7)-methyltransferase
VSPAGDEGCGAPDPASAVFGDRLSLAEAYRARLAADGIIRGLIGPREADRLWDRHLLNCAVLTDLVPVGARVVDVGSGAGLPGLPMAIRRADLQVDLIEPMQRRTDFLAEVVSLLGLTDSVRVIRGRADDPAVLREAGNSAWVVARALAPLDRLARWCLPLLGPGGRLLALKGAGVAAEIDAHREELRRLGAEGIGVRQIGGEWLAEPVTVVEIGRVSARSAVRQRRAKE